MKPISVQTFFNYCQSELPRMQLLAQLLTQNISIVRSKKIIQVCPLDALMINISQGVIDIPLLTHSQQPTTKSATTVCPLLYQLYLTWFKDDQEPMTEYTQQKIACLIKWMNKYPTQPKQALKYFNRIKIESYNRHSLHFLQKNAVINPAEQNRLCDAFNHAYFKQQEDQQINNQRAVLAELKSSVRASTP